MEDMVKEKKDFNWKLEDVRQKFLQAILLEVTFDGWSEQAFDAALKSSTLDHALVKLAFPKGAVDVAAYMHKIGDQAMVDGLPSRNHNETSMSKRIENAINLRLEIANTQKEEVRRAATLFAMPQYAKLSTELIWGTADAIWNALGDDAKGFEFYSKRTSLSAVYSSSFLYFLQDETADMTATKEFVARRIVDVGKFGKFTSKFKRKTK